MRITTLLMFVCLSFTSACGFLDEDILVDEETYNLEGMSISGVGSSGWGCGGSFGWGRHSRRAPRLAVNTNSGPSEGFGEMKSYLNDSAPDGEEFDPRASENNLANTPVALLVEHVEHERTVAVSDLTSTTAQTSENP